MKKLKFRLNRMNRNLLYWFAIMRGREFVGNCRTHEVHYLRYRHRNCKLDLLSKKNRVVMSMPEAMNAIEDDYNGCRWCWPQKDNG
jgi:hypothetical protein